MKIKPSETNSGASSEARFPTCCWTASPRAGSKNLFNGTITPSKDSLTAFFDKISSHRSRGYTSGSLLDKPTAFILQALKERGCWKNGSLESDVRSLTGPVARMRKNPTVAGLLMSDGNTNYTRFVARFIEVLSAADLIRML